jgi:hypothetical protein
MGKLQSSSKLKNLGLKQLVHSAAEEKDCSFLPGRNSLQTESLTIKMHLRRKLSSAFHSLTQQVIQNERFFSSFTKALVALAVPADIQKY